ncbi:hypothetical protein LCGC14_1576420, partial [marine sediment metagenome]
MGLTDPFGQAKARIRQGLDFVSGPVKEIIKPALDILDDIPKAIMTAV